MNPNRERCLISEYETTDELPLAPHNKRTLPHLTFLQVQITKLIEDVEHLFTKHLLNANQRVGMKPLRPRTRREKRGVSFLSGV